MKVFKILFFITIFLGGIYFYGKYANSKQIEGLTTINGELRCPNLLIQKDSKYYLYNSELAKVPGVNPIEFNNLEEYVEFLEWQRGAGIRCPVLYLQNTYDAQGERVYKIRPSVTELQGGLPPSAPVTQEPRQYYQPTPPHIGQNGNNLNTLNVQQRPASQTGNNLQQLNANINANAEYTGTGTARTLGSTAGIIDADDCANEDGNLLFSPNPMCQNWGGAEFTESLVDAGYYAGNEVMIKIA